MKSITPFLWFDGNAEEAKDFYLSVFDDAELIYTPPPMPTDGSPMGVTLRLKNLEVTLFNGGSTFKLDEAFSLMVTCEDQAEVDRYWDALIEGGGKHSQCGWLKDKFGVSWQIVPQGIMDFYDGSDPEGVQRAWQAMLKMTKLDIGEMQRAYDGVPAST